MQQEATTSILATPAAVQPGLWNRIENSYVEKVQGVYTYLKDRNWKFVANLIAAFFIEPFNSIKAGYLMQRGLRDNLNPKSLTPDKQKQVPIFLIHGDHSNSAIFTPLIDQILSRFPERPIFTIDIVSPDGIVSEANLPEVIAKVRQIKALYSFSPRIDFIGHSSGGDILAPLVQTEPTPGLLIKIGSVFKAAQAQAFNARALEVLGEKDIFEGSRSFLDKKFVVRTGHLGLLFDSTAHNYICDQLKPEIFRNSSLGKSP